MRNRSHYSVATRGGDGTGWRRQRPRLSRIRSRRDDYRELFDVRDILNNKYLRDGDFSSASLSPDRGQRQYSHADSSLHLKADRVVPAQFYVVGLDDP